MLDAARDARAFSKGKTRSELDSNRMLTLSLVKCIEIIGEAAGQISRELRESISKIPWPDIIGMRNRLIHVYYDVNHDIVWQTIEKDLPPLIVTLESLLKSESKP